MRYKKIMCWEMVALELCIRFSFVFFSFLLFVLFVELIHEFVESS